jgi:hypothetical protein
MDPEGGGLNIFYVTGPHFAGCEERSHMKSIPIVGLPTENRTGQIPNMKQEF